MISEGQDADVPEYKSGRDGSLTSGPSSGVFGSSVAVLCLEKRVILTLARLHEVWHCGPADSRPVLSAKLREVFLSESSASVQPADREAALYLNEHF